MHHRWPVYQPVVTNAPNYTWSFWAFHLRYLEHLKRCYTNIDGWNQP